MTLKSAICVLQINDNSKRKKNMIFDGIRTSKMKYFDVKEFFRINFDLKNRCKNEFKDNNEKS